MTSEDSGVLHWFDEPPLEGSERRTAETRCGAILTPLGSETLLKHCPKCDELVRPSERTLEQTGTPSVEKPVDIPPSHTYSSSSRVPASALYKTEGTAMILSIILGLFLCQGVGHIYIGRTQRGVILLIASLAGLVVGVITLAIGVGILILVGVFVLFIWQIFDCQKQCRVYNEHLAAHGRPPW